MHEFERMSKVRPLMRSLYRSAKENLSFKQDATIVILEDGDNAANPLGKTAYYDPANNKISLYTQGRHVKDVMRSLAHELVHHAQNCRGQFGGGIATVDGYAQEDGHLREMEREAYECGNMIFRDWEDGIKHKSNNSALFNVGVSTGEKLMNEVKVSKSEVSKSVLDILRTWPKHGKTLLNFKRSDHKAEDLGYVEMGKTNPNIYHLTDLGRKVLAANPTEEKQMGEKLMENQEAKLREVIRGLVREVVVSVKETIDEPGEVEENLKEQCHPEDYQCQENERVGQGRGTGRHMEEKELGEENTFFPTNHDIRSKARIQTNEALMKRWGFMKKEK